MGWRPAATSRLEAASQGSLPPDCPGVPPHPASRRKSLEAFPFRTEARAGSDKIHAEDRGSGNLDDSIGNYELGTWSRRGPVVRNDDQRPANTLGEDRSYTVRARRGCRS